MKTKNNDLSRNLLIGGILTAVTVAVAIAMQRKRMLSGNAENLFNSCENALQKLGERVGQCPA
jgi:hypothetical protein